MIRGARYVGKPGLQKNHFIPFFILLFFYSFILLFFYFFVFFYVFFLWGSVFPNLTRNNKKKRGAIFG